MEANEVKENQAGVPAGDGAGCPESVPAEADSPAEAQAGEPPVVEAQEAEATSPEPVTEVPEAEAEADSPAEAQAGEHPVTKAQEPEVPSLEPVTEVMEAEAAPESASGGPSEPEPVTEPEVPPAAGQPAESEPFPAEQLLPLEAEPVSPTSPAALKAVLEAIIYVTEEPLSSTQIAAALGEPRKLVEEALEQLVIEYDRAERGLTIREVAGGYKMATKPEHHEAVRAFVKKLKPPLKLSLAALETLAVVAYKQPVTAPEIMEIRGVQGAGVLKTLLDRKLVAAAGRKNVIGKPILYKTTRDFLLQFGLKDLAELPSLKEFEELRRIAVSDADIAPEPASEPETPVEPGGAAEAAATADRPGAAMPPEQAASAPEPWPAPEPVGARAEEVPEAESLEGPSPMAAGPVPAPEPEPTPEPVAAGADEAPDAESRPEPSPVAAEPGTEAAPESAPPETTEDGTAAR